MSGPKEGTPNGVDRLAERALTRDQVRALRYLEANHGSGTEGGLFLEGLNRPRHTLRSLARRGLVVRVQWWDEEWGDEYDLTSSALARLDSGAAEGDA